jgi:hypothetical protein
LALLWPIAPTAQVVERSQKAIDEVVLVAVVAAFLALTALGDPSARFPLKPHISLTEVSRKMALAWRGGLARAHAAVKKHPGYSESGYLLAVEIAFANWEAIQNIGRQDRPG